MENDIILSLFDDFYKYLPNQSDTKVIYIPYQIMFVQYMFPRFAVEQKILS